MQQYIAHISFIMEIHWKENIWENPFNCHETSYLCPVKLNGDDELLLDILNNSGYTAGYATCKDAFGYGIFEWSCKFPMGNNLVFGFGLTDENNKINCVSCCTQHKVNGFLKSQAKPRFMLNNKNITSDGFAKPVWKWYINEKRTNYFMLIWTPNCIKVFYNSHCVVDVKDNNLIELYRNCKMKPFMSLGVTGEFNKNDYIKYISTDQPFVFRNFKYMKIED